jgi:hypothetical protein
MMSSKLAAATPVGVAAVFFLSSLIAGFSATPRVAAPVSSAQEREAAAERFVNQKLQLWQERLDLKNWKLTVKLLRPSELEPKTMGNIRWDTDKKEAAIGVLSSYDYNLPWKEMLDDMEFTIVHEMVHLHLASLPRSEASRRNEEHAVNELTTALLNLARR